MIPTISEAFDNHHVVRADGVAVLNHPTVSVAGLAAGYHFKHAAIEEALKSTKHKGQMTKEEFLDFSEKHKDTSISAEQMAQHLVNLSTDGKITRAILEKETNKEIALSPEETENLFAVLDENETGCIRDTQLMELLYGEKGKQILEALRKAELDAARRRQQEKLAADRSAKEPEKKKKATCGC